MKKYDFILIYEHKVRELECLYLLKSELEKNGYSVLIMCYHDKKIYQSAGRVCKPKLHAKVLGVYACYDNETLKGCVENYISFDKVINLQWEQMIARNQEKKNSYRNFSGIGKEVVHIAWGEKNRKRLIEQAGIPDNRIFLCGNMSLDFLRPEFTSYFMSKEEICEKYGFPSDSKICVLFANYRGAELDEGQLEILKKKYGESRIAVQKLGKKTKKTVLEWIEKAAEEFPECMFIYRPHPGENTDEVHKKFAEIKNVYIISDYSSKQWVVIADYLFSWHSTVVIEAFVNKKNCYSLEPYGYVAEEDMSIFDNMQGIKEYEKMKAVLEGEQFDIGLDRKDIISIYGEYDIKEPSYVRVAEAFVKVLKESLYDLSLSEEKKKIYTKKYNDVKQQILGNAIANFIYWKTFPFLIRENAWWAKRHPVHASHAREKEKVIKLETASKEEMKKNEIRLSQFISN